MAREEHAVFTNLCMITDGQGNVLVEDRKDPSWPGICFPGGHVEPGEAFTDSVIREVKEETGLTIENPRLCGVKQFQTDSGARYVVFFYKASKFSGQLKCSDEGDVFWVPRETLGQIQAVDDFMDMVRVMESSELNEFYYYIEDGKWGLKLL